MSELTTDFYAARAAEARRFAEDTTDEGDRAIYKRIAENYEELVRRGVPQPFTVGRPALPVNPER